MAGDEKSTAPLLAEELPPPSAAPSPKGAGSASADDAGATKDASDVLSGGGSEGALERSSASADPASAEEVNGDDEPAEAMPPATAAAALEEVKGEAKDGYAGQQAGRAGGEVKGEAKGGYGAEVGGGGGGSVSFAEDSLSLDGSSLEESTYGIENVNYVGPHEFTAPWIAGDVRIGEAFEGGKLGDEAYSSTRVLKAGLMSAPDKEMLAEQQKGQMLGEVAEESVGYLSPTLREGVGYGERPMTPDPRDPGSQGLHYRSGMTWGYDIIKALDADDPIMLTAALQGQDVKPDAVVDRDGYGGYAWSAWSHRMAGDTVLHLAMRWKRYKALKGLYRLPAQRPDGMVGAGQSFFDYDVRDVDGQTAESLVTAEFGRTIANLWTKQEKDDIEAAEEAARQAALEAEAARSLAYSRLNKAHKQAREDYRLAVRAKVADADAEVLLQHHRVLAPAKPPELMATNEDRLEAKKNIWAAAGVRPKHGTGAFGGSGQNGGGGGRPGQVKQSFPVDVENYNEHVALKDVLRRMRDNQPALTRISSVHELKYSGVIGTPGARVLGRALPAASELTHLILPNQRIGPDGAAALCAGLAEHNASLTYLDLRANGLMDAGARAVADLLSTDRKLKIVNLEANRIGDEGAKALAAVVTSDWCLQRLSLSQNSEITLDGYDALRDGVNARGRAPIRVLTSEGEPVGIGEKVRQRSRARSGKKV